jgi:hypothetical protein
VRAQMEITCPWEPPRHSMVRTAKASISMQVFYQVSQAAQLENLVRF